MKGRGMAVTEGPADAGYGQAATAAFEIQVQLSTRVGCRTLGRSEGILREALYSLHSMFEIVRDVLETRDLAGAAAAGDRDAAAVLECADELLEGALRPFLDRWHPLLAAYEGRRPEGRSVVEHEGRWERAEEFRAALRDLGDRLTEVNRKLAGISGTDLEPPLPAR